MTSDEFKRLAALGYNRIPLVHTTFSDLETPLSVYLKLANQPFSYLLESVQGGERFGRYSYVGLPSSQRLEVSGNRCTEFDRMGMRQQIHHEDPLTFVSEFQKRFQVAPSSELPRFSGGLVGYFGYDCIRYIEKKVGPCLLPDPLETPDISLMLSDQLAVIDNLSGRIHLIVYADPRERNGYEQAQDELQRLVLLLQQPLADPQTLHPVAESDITAQSEFSDDAFYEVVDRAKRYIADGDIMQVVLSQRISQPFTRHPLTLYRALRALNPSPYMFYFDFEDFHVVGASPEILVRLENNAVTLRPIAGTRPRGKTAEQDQQLARDLLADPKECAEHVMLVDLGRNDVGRVSQKGTIRVTEQMLIENYSHVMHIVSNVDGVLEPGLNALDVLRATFPAGTVSGAPKIRAMQIIDELEPSKRGIYAGAIGYLGFNGDMDLAIAIRTGVIKDQTLYVQAGAGIVADSVPETEWIETRDKASAVLEAAKIAQTITMPSTFPTLERK